MRYRGRVVAVCIVILFNILRYGYYNIYLGYLFEKSFFVLTGIFLLVAWIGGRQYDVAKFYAEKDPLTNAYNRRTIDKVFKKQISQYKNQRKKIGVVLIDLDNFKYINDTFGHQTGDELLRCVAECIMSNSKKEDYVVRWGGDEFVHVILDLKEDTISEYVRSLRSKLSDLDVESVSAVSASIGIAVYPDDGETFEVLIQKADTSMYEMKKA
ncbi:GGDEF domain-containing protein [Sporosarcina sp. P21c]|uniref:GGDEF domain-containing protein n=1 Tax=unclassified Sporosarcina TaxID=2647733 RepID=UPI000C16A577|nr:MULTISPECIES: GGDEF domain-containing protein [unclassified Sporosarcina]PIC67446.1 GGDEF domain-containing protein [Sporosarcina sp. P16a]PIC89701.1 GGDEF domain-containing protein [Sporosarcina sp. P21c]PIC92897.1 GGDEF domain-containing protein [Sporosarcina sp. P25]